MTRWHYIAQRATTGEFLTFDLPLHRDELSWALSGPGSLRGTVAPDVGNLRAEDGRLLLEEWGTLLYAEADGEIRWGGILVRSEFNGSEWSIEAAGFTTYPHGIPYLGTYSRIGVDPAEVVRHLWEHVQGFPDGDLGVSVVGATRTGAQLGTPETVDEEGEVVEAEPYELLWWEAPDVGEEIDDLAQETPFDYVEEHEWAPDEYVGEHEINLVPPLSEWRAVQGAPVILGEDEVHLPEGSRLMSPPLPVRGAERWRFAAEVFATEPSAREGWGDGGAGYHFSVTYYGRDGSRAENSAGVTTNGRASTFPPHSWQRVAWGTARGGPDVDHIIFEIQSTTVYGQPSGITVRRPTWEYADDLPGNLPAYTRHREPVEDRKILHRVVLGYPRLGRRRTDLAFIQGDNVTSVVAPEFDGDEFANSVLGIGAGEGEGALRRSTAVRDGRLRRVYTHTAKNVSSARRLDSEIARELRRRRDTLEISSVDVVDHPNAPIGSWSVGDDVLVEASLPWLGDVSLWCRITGWSLLSDHSARLDLARSDSFDYGG